MLRHFPATWRDAPQVKIGDLVEIVTHFYYPGLHREWGMGHVTSVRETGFSVRLLNEHASPRELDVDFDRFGELWDLASVVDRLIRGIYEL